MCSCSVCIFKIQHLIRVLETLYYFPAGASLVCVSQLYLLRSELSNLVSPSLIFRAGKSPATFQFILMGLQLHTALLCRRPAIQVPKYGLVPNLVYPGVKMLAQYSLSLGLLFHVLLLVFEMGAVICCMPVQEPSRSVPPGIAVYHTATPTGELPPSAESYCRYLLKHSSGALLRLSWY